VPFSYLDEKNIFKRYKDAKSYTDKLTLPFPEFERLARNRPSDDIADNLPRTTDGTTSSIIRKTPKRVVQQLPTGVIESDDDESWLPIVAQYIYTEKILPYANEDYELIQKCWTNIENGLSFGFGASYSPFINHDGYFCPDMTLPYWGDIAIQPGKKSGYASNYVFIRSWWQKEDIDSLIEQEKQLASQARKRGEKYEPTWDVDALKAIRNTVTSKDDQGKTPMEDDRGVSSDAIELITGFQNGTRAKFFTFNYETQKIVRTKINKDPRGKMPIDWLYGDIDGSNPFGRGIIELIGGLQNLIDSDMQMYQYNRALLLAPPVIKRGSFPKSRIVYEPNHIIDVGSEAGATVEPLQIDSSAIAKYPELYGLQKSQLLNLVSSPDTSISSEVGNPGFSKTDAGVKDRQAVISVDDNYVRKMFEAWFQNWSETAINLYFGERTGKEILQLDEDTVMKLKELASEGKFDMNMLNEKNQILIDYDTATPALKFRVDASTSKMKNDSEQLDAMQGLMSVVNENPLIAQFIMTYYPEKIAGAWNAIVAASGVEDPEELAIDLDDFKQKQMAAQQAQMGAQSEQMQAEAAKPPSMSVNYKDAPEDIKRQMEQADGFQPSQMVSPVQQQADQKQQELEMQGMQQATDQNGQFMQYLQALNLPGEALQIADQALSSGATPEEVMQSLGGQYARG